MTTATSVEVRSGESLVSLPQLSKFTHFSNKFVLDHDDLYPCGPASPNRIDENDPKPPKTTTSKAPTQTPAPGKPKREEGKLNSFARRWLQEGKIGEEYAPCFSCPSGRKNASDCAVVKTYEYNQTTLSQCYTRRYETLPNGTETSEAWMVRQKQYGLLISTMY